MRQPIYSERLDRLTSRLEGLLSMWRIAQKLQRPFNFLWPSTCWPFTETNGYAASDIFDLKAMSSASPDLQIIQGGQGQPAGTEPITLLPGWPLSIKLGAAQRITCPLYGYAEYNPRFFGEQRSRIEAEHIQLFHKLQSQPHMNSMIQQARAWIGEEAFIAIHIRQGDILPRMASAIAAYRQDDHKSEEELLLWVQHTVARMVPLKSYARALAAYPNLPVIIFSDTPSAAESLRHILSGRRVRMMEDYVTELTDIQRVWLEVKLMMKAVVIIGTNSTFSNFAARYAQLPLIDARKHTTYQEMEDFYRSLFLATTDPLAPQRCLQQLQSVWCKEKWRLQRHKYMKCVRPILDSFR